MEKVWAMEKEESINLEWGGTSIWSALHSPERGNVPPNHQQQLTKYSVGDQSTKHNKTEPWYQVTTHNTSRRYLN